MLLCQVNKLASTTTGVVSVKQLTAVKRKQIGVAVRNVYLIVLIEVSLVRYRC